MYVKLAKVSGENKILKEELQIYKDEIDNLENELIDRESTNKSLKNDKKKGTYKRILHK